MYFYLSWLRPPPRSSPVNEQVALTPQVANDLRTELFEDELRISYQWLPSSAAAPTALTQPVLPLTTWHGSGSAYKALAVDPPKGVKVGEAWSLALFSSVPVLRRGTAFTLPTAAASGQAPTAAARWKTDLLELARVEDSTRGGWSPIAVKSEPVRFTSAKGGAAAGGKGAGKGKGKAASSSSSSDKAEKQDRIQRTFVLPPVVGRDDQPELHLTEQTSFDLDKKIWDSGLAVAAFLAYRLQRSTPPYLPAPTFAPEGEARLAPQLALLLNEEGRTLRILELGTGSGLVAIALACLLRRAHAADAKHQIFATDLPSALPLVARNVKANKAVFADAADVHGRALDWEAAELPAWAWAEQPGDAPRAHDLVCLVDVTYNVSVFPALLRTLLALLKPPADVAPPAEGRQTLVLLAWKERDPTGAEKELWRLAAEAGVVLELVGSDGAHGGAAVEFWVGRLADQ